MVSCDGIFHPLCNVHSVITDTLEIFCSHKDIQTDTCIRLSVIQNLGQLTEMDILDFKSASRCYFMDMGLANYYLTRTGTDSRVLAGTLNENYVYINLKKRQDFPQEISFETPAFATYRGGEIDFVAQSLSSSTRYLIEVKAGKGTASTAQKALAQGKADKLLYLKGATKGGIDGKTETLPIYLLEQYKFN